MTQVEQSKKAKEFYEYWKDNGDEKQGTQRYWIGLLGDVLGISNATNYIEFEKRVKLTHTSYIDAYINDTKVLIEQKSSNVDLTTGSLQSDKAFLTPFQQAKRYADELPYDLRPRWIVVSNFTEIHVHDMNNPHAEPEIILLKNLEKEFYRLSFLVSQENVHLKREMELSIKAGEIVGDIYDKLLAQYQLVKNIDMEKCLKSLNMLCVRLVFCLYAEDAGIFGHKSMFGEYLNRFEAKDLRGALLNLFKILDQKPEERDPFLEDELSCFPYVNGGLFTEEDQFIPQFTDELKNLLIEKASDDFNWSEISPTIFGAVFESTLNPETRRSGGMHYTSIENIHKVIDPLFLNDLKEEFESIKNLKQEKTRENKLIEFQKKLGSLKFLDPACGSGNFLTESYLSLRRLENECLSLLFNKNAVMDFFDDIILVKIHQFYGIEINDFASVVAKTALWIAESQMMSETSKILQRNLDFLPLKSYANIVEGNALRLDWETVIPKNELNYIMGNPPFVGYKLLTKSQKEDLNLIIPKARSMDYVVAWYFKTLDFINNAENEIQCAFVSTNSITQGDAIENVWKPMFEKFNVKINFAWQSFIWDSEANLKAHVHCVIIGFGLTDKKNKKIYNSNVVKLAKNINPYLMDADNVFLERLGKPLCRIAPEMTKGAQLIDGGGFVLNNDKEKEEFLSKYPEADPFIYQYLNSHDFINNSPKKYCLYLKHCPPNVIKGCKGIYDRVQMVKSYRENSDAETTRVLAKTPTQFFQSQVPEGRSIIIPVVSSENRRYIPMAFMPTKFVYTNALFYIDYADIFHFGILTSNVHMAWTRVICGRLKSDYRYSNSIVYNNFPWCNPTEEQKAKIEQTAQAILDARAKYPDSSLADLYDELTMPTELRKAHQENDKAVMSAYGFAKNMTESEIVAELFKMYEKLTEGK